MKKYIGLSAIVLSLFGAAQPALAYTNKSGEISALTTADYDSNDPFSWRQTVAPYSGTFGPNGLSYRAASCMIHAAAFTQIKTGSKPIGYTPYDLYESLEKDNAYQYGYADYSKINWGNDWEMLPGDQGVGSSYRSATYQDVVDAWNQGYMVVMRVNSPAGYHQIAVDTITDDGQMIIFDSGFGGADFETIYDKGDVMDMVLYKSKSGVKASELPTLYNHRDGSQIFAQVEVDGQAAKTAKQVEDEKAQAIAKAAEEERLKAEKAKADARAESDKNILAAQNAVARQKASQAIEVVRHNENNITIANAYVAIDSLQDGVQESYRVELEKIIND